jgi:hypothetical protein
MRLLCARSQRKATLSNEAPTTTGPYSMRSTTCFWCAERTPRMTKERRTYKPRIVGDKL